MQASLILHFTKQDLVDRYKGSLLGVLWNIIMPLTMISIFVFVFSEIMGARLANFDDRPYAYGIYLVSGILFWNLFASTSQRISQVFEEKKPLIKKNQIHLITLPIYILLSESVIFFISVLLFVGFLLLIDAPIGWNWGYLIPVYALTLLLGYVIGFSVAVFSVFIKDLKELLKVVLQLWFWLTPIVYVITILPGAATQYLQLNPMYWVVTTSQNVVLYQTQPKWLALLTLLAVFTAAAWVLVVLTRKLEKDIRDFI
ncbi:MAG: ABC transporter permease [Hydrogenovibrio sp.]|uniref:ABC transporter permease n=1 Tax=Hydrogenovibrio sp. TaxID=2065821 RepID=UPI00286FF845|nr:ABC transporter permease [Hydrogenovibrio sp.]MDR9499702.1 ABC transporter permease [Hydrogenovibrio sp.]